MHVHMCVCVCDTLLQVALLKGFTFTSALAGDNFPLSSANR